MITHKVSKISGRESLKLFRRLAVAIVLFLIAQMGWGETYYWTGAAGDGKWSTSGNWNTAPDGTGTTLESGYPNGYDNVRFPKGAEINVDVTTNEIDGTNYLYLTSLQIPNNNIENSDFTVKLTGNPIYVYDLIEIYRATGPTAGDSKSTLELDCDIVASELVIHSGTTVQIDSGHTANITNVTNVGGNDYPAKIIVEGSLISDKITLSDNSDRILEITGGSVETGIITGTSNSVINNGSLSISNVSGSDIGVLKAGGNGTLDLNGDNTYIWKGTEDEDWANANNWTGGVPNSDTAVIRIENDSPYPTIKSSDEYEIKSIDNYNQPKINIYGKLKINDDFCYAVGVDSEYIRIDSDGYGVLELTGKFYTKTSFSIGVSIICNDFQTGSNFECENLTVNGNAKIGAMVVTHGFQHYAGTLSGDLNDYDPNDYSDITLISHYNSNNDSDITIAGAVSKITTLQIQGYDDLTIQNTISDIENLILDTSESSSAILNGQVNITNEFRTSAPVLLKQNVYVGGDVYGPFVSDTGQKLVFNGSGDQKFYPSTSSSDFSYTTIEEYKSSGSLTIENSSSGVKITDFVIEQGIETIFNQGGEITNLTIKDGGITKFTDDITIDTFTDLSTAGNIIFQDDITLKNVTDQTFKTNGKIIFDYNAYITFGTSSPYSNIKHVAGPTEIYGQLTVNSIEFGETTIYHWVETNGDQKYTDAVILVGAPDSLEGELELISRQGKISFESTINSKENYNVGLGISLQNDDYAISLADSVGLINPLKYFNVYNPLEIASGCTAITTTGSQGYQNTVTIDEDVTLTSGSTITFASTIDSKTDTTKKITFEVPTDKAISVDGKVGNSEPVAVEITQAGSITFNNTVNITEFSDTANSGDITFNKDATISNASGTTFNTSGTVTFGNASTDVTTFGTSPSSLAALTHSTGPTVLNGTLYASDITLGNTNATPGTISIPSGSISASGTVSLDGALTSSDSVSISAGTLAFNAPVEVKNITMDAEATTSQNFTVTGNWTNNKAKSGTTYGFTATAGTVTFTGANPTDSVGVLLSGENRFNELEILGSVKITANNEITTLTADNGTSGLGGKTITFADSTTQTVTGTMSLKGTSSDSKLVLYANAGDEWEINCTGTNNHTIKYVDIYNSNNSSSYNLVALNSSDKGHNTKWTFPGEDYEWTGADPTYPTRWDVSANWSPASVPGLGADVTIPTGKSSYPIISSAIDLYYNSDNKGSITNNGTITFNESGSITADTKQNGSESTIIYDGAFVDATTLDWGYEYENLIFTSGTFNLSDALSVNNFTVGSAAKVSTTANITVTGNWTNNNSTDGFTATGGTVKLTTASNDTTRATLSGANTFYNLNLDRNISVLASNTISQDLIMHRTAGDAEAKGNIYFAANTKQTIGGKFDFKGLTTKRLLATCGNATAETNGTWEIECTGPNNHELQNINLKGCLNSSGYPLVVQDPDGTQANGKSQDSGGNIYFYFLNHAYTWQGGANDSATNWGNASYWSPASVPGKGSVITIPAGKTSYPVLTSALDLKYDGTYAGSITIADGGKLDLADQKLTVGTIINSGLVRLKGVLVDTSSQIDGSVDNGTSDSTIEYYDTTTTLDSSTLAWGDSYKKLIINKPSDLHDVALAVSKTTTIAAGTTNAVNLNNENNSFGETISLGDSAAATPVNAGAVTINAASAITIANNANADSLTLNCPATVTNITTTGSQTYNGQITLAANATLTVSGASSQINLNENVNGSDKTLTIPSGSQAVLAAGITVAPAVTNNGTITCSGAATFEKSYSGTGASLTLSNNTTTFKADLDLSGTTFAHGNGTVIIDEIGTEAQVKGPAAFNIFELKKSAKIYGDNSYNTFTATNLGGKSISFEASKTQTITGILTLSGSSGSLLTLKNEGTGIWYINCSNPDISFVDVIYSTSTNSIFAISSNDSGYNTNWNFPGEDYEWTGADSINPTRWDIASNWSPASVPGIGAKVTIPEISSTTASYPKLIAPLSIKNDTYSGTITVEPSAQFDLADQSLTVGTITNNGLIRLKGVLVGTSDQIDGSVDNGTSDSTIEYYDTTTTLDSSTLAWGNSYKKLIINKPANLNDVPLTVSKTTTIAAGTTNTVNLNNENNSFGETISLGDSAAATPVNAGAVTLKASSPIILTNNANADSLTVNSAVKLQNVTTSGNQTYSGTVETITGEAAINSTAGDISFENPVTLGVKTSVTANGTGKTITFGNAATINGAQALSLSSNGGTTFGANVGNTNALSALTVTGPLTVNCELIKTTGAQLYNSPVEISSGTTRAITSTGDGIHFVDTVTLNNNTTISVASNNQIAFDKAVTGNAASSLTTNETTVFNTNAVVSGLTTLTTNKAIINCASITTSDAQTYNGAVTLSKDGDITLTAKNASDEYQTVQFYGNVSCATSVTPNLILDANTNISCSNVTVTGTQTYNGTVQVDTTATITSSTASLIFKDDLTITENVILAASASGKEIDFAKNISGSGKKLTVNTPVFKSIATAGNSSSITLGELEFSQDTSIQSQNPTPISLTIPKISGTGKTVTLTASVSELSFIGNVEFNPNITTAENSHFKASSGTMTFKADVNFADNTLAANDGTIILTAANKNPASLNGSNTFYNLTLTGGGKTIKFGAGTRQEVSGKLTLRGTANTDGNRLNLRSSIPTTTSSTGSQWEIKCTGANAHDIEFVDVQDSKNESETGTPTATAYYLFALNSIDHGNNTKWNFPGMQYTWTGADSTDPTNWNIAANWEYLSIPGKGADVLIPEITTAPIHYPKLIADLDLNDSYGNPAVSYTGKITIAANAQFDLAGKNLTLGEITNKGLVRLIGASDQTISGKMVNGAGSTVEYYGTGATATNFAWDGEGTNATTGKQYANLILNQDTSSSEILTVSKNLTINNPSTLTGQLTVTGTTTIAAGTGKTVSLDNASNIFAGNVIAGSSTGTSFVAGVVTLRAGSLITLANNANADSLTVNSAVQLQNVTTSGNQSYTGTVKTITGDAELKSTGGNISFADDLTLDVKTTVISATGTIEFGNSATIDGAKQLSLSSAAGTTFGANVGNGTALASLSVEGALSVNCEVIKTSGNQSYNGAVTLVKDTILLQSTSATGTITFSSTAPIDGTKELTISTTAGTTFNASVGSGTGSELAKLTVAGPLDINCAEINTSGNQSYQGNVKVSSTQASLVSSAGDISFTNPDANVYGNKLILTVAVDKTIVFKGTTGTQANPLAELNNVSASETTFEKPVYIGTFAETVDPGNITFKSGGNIVTSTQFHTTGNITLTDTLTLPSLQMNNLIVNGTAKVKTSGAQTYDGTINGKTAATDILTLDSGAGVITFNGDIGQTLPPHTLNITGQTSINCAAITSSGTQTYNSAITLGTAPSPQTHTLTASGMSFASTINGGADLIINTTDGTNFAANLGADTPLASLETNGPATIGCNAITTSGNQHYKNALVLTASPTLTSSGGNLTFDSTIDGQQLLTLSVPQNTTSPAAIYTITVAGKVGQTNTPSVTIAQAGNVNFGESVKTANFIITKANDSTFAKEVDSSTFTITQADNTLFNKPVNVTDFTITNAVDTRFNETVQISSFTDASTAGDITFKNGGTISTATDFKTTGTVTFGDASADIMTFGTASPYENLTHNAGDTNITGILNAANITLAQTAGGPMTIANSGLFKTVDGEALTYTTSFTQNGTGNSVIGGSFTGNGNASFATNVQLYGSSQADFGSSGNAVSIAKNLIILRAATDDLNINSRINVTENLILYKGPVVADADITVGKDILVLGSAYSLTDTSTGITNEYAYACVRPETWSQPNYVETLLPDGNAVPATGFTGTLSVSSGKIISAAKNFYANGTALSTNGTTGQWTLKIPDLTNAANAFAEAYHSEISGCKVICNDSSSTDGTKSRLVCLECDDTGTTNTPNSNVDFDDFEITAAYTERDNSIRVEFNRPVRYYDATVQTLKFQNADGSPVLNFTGLYSDPDCQNEIEYDTQLSYFYIKAAPQNDSQYGAWNTDATGRSSGAADDQSTDRSGIHHENIPALDFARALINGTTTQSFIFTDRWGKRLNNYSSRTPTAKTAYGSTGDTETSHEVADKTGPVLYSVRTGQELHDAYNPSTGAAGEHSYDSHNFIEFVYSEKVDFDGSSDDTTLNDSPSTAENVQVNDALGAVKGDITKADNLQLAGLGILEHGLLHTGKNGADDKYVSALYRKGTNAEYAIRLSIAGYTDPSVTLTDDSGYTYKKWIGYIEQATMPSGTVKHLVDSNKKNERVKDKDGNVQIKYADNSSGEPVFDTIPTINNTENGTFGAWDLSEPVFALYRQNAAKTHWEQSEFDKNYYAEAIGNNSGVGSTLDRIEFHLYDNTPEFDEQGSAVTGTPEWFTEVGWCNPNSIGEKPQDLYKSYSYAADIFGGARPFDSNASRRTSGGIRYSTIYSSVNAFKYGVGSALQERLITTSFNNSKIGIPGASSLIFTGTSSPRRSAGDSEGLYFALPLANTSLDIKTSFTVKYDDSVGFITDLAGNRLRTKIFSTIDRTPPSIDMTVCPVGGDEMEIIFVKELCIDSDKLEYNDNTTGEKVAITEQFESLITNCFDFITINSSGTHQVATDLTVDHTVPAKITVKENQNGSAFTIIHLKLSRTVTLDDIKNKFIRVIYAQQYGEYSVDLFTGHPGSRVTFIQDENGNNIQMYTAHALSDFAVGIINPLYAYDSAMTEEDGTIISDSLFRANLTDDVDEKGWAVHDWNRDQKNYGTLPAKRPVAIVADTADGSEENDDAPVSFRLYLSNNPDAASVSTQYNKDLEPDTQWRIWLPNEMSGVFTSLSEKNNTNYSQVDGTLLSDDISNRMIFDVGQTIVNQWAAGNQISFLFGLTNSDGTPVTIMHSPELDINNDKQYLSTSAKMPLFALRQTEPANLMSLDLWSFRLKDVVSQRGGVTILNNVINSSQREKVVVKVNQPQQGNLTVLVMTLDGSIVDYLHRGTSEAGEHFYSWDGTNRRGHSVARGMYFIRVTGPGIDETRKVMVVKD